MTRVLERKETNKQKIFSREEEGERKERRRQGAGVGGRGRKELFIFDRVVILC